MRNKRFQKWLEFRAQQVAKNKTFVTEYKVLMRKVAAGWDNRIVRSP